MLSIGESTPLTNHRPPDIEAPRCKTDCRHPSQAMLVGRAAEIGGLSYFSPGKVLPDIRSDHLRIGPNPTQFPPPPEEFSLHGGLTVQFWRFGRVRKPIRPSFSSFRHTSPIVLSGILHQPTQRRYRTPWRRKSVPHSAIPGCRSPGNTAQGPLARPGRSEHFAANPELRPVPKTSDSRTSLICP